MSECIIVVLWNRFCFPRYLLVTEFIYEPVSHSKLRWLLNSCFIPLRDWYKKSCNKIWSQFVIDWFNFNIHLHNKKEKSKTSKIRWLLNCHSVILYDLYQNNYVRKSGHRMLSIELHLILYEIRNKTKILDFIIFVFSTEGDNVKYLFLLCWVITFS